MARKGADMHGFRVLTHPCAGAGAALFFAVTHQKESDHVP
ncbi:hypothetical protein RGAI101_1131 [Roseobacter sp. GAI101]|nr:hypothetical protein RGAI101_1131 [Roseobacter sp. GAI101]